MKIKIQYTIIISILTLLVVNIVLFAHSAVLADEAVKIEKDLKKIKLDNLELEKDLYTSISLKNLQYMAPFLGFTKKSQPFFFDNPSFASLN